MTQGRINIQDIFSDLDDIELSLEEDTASDSDRFAASEGVQGYLNISPFSIYLSETRKFHLIDHETEFWYGVIITAGKVLKESHVSVEGDKSNKQDLLNYLLNRITQDILNINEIKLPSYMVSLDVADLFSEALILRMDNYYGKSSFLLNLINENNIHNNQQWESLAALAVDILACLIALPLELFIALSSRFYELRNNSVIPQVSSFLENYSSEKWSLEIVFDRVAKARENLCLANIRLVFKYAKKYKGYGVPFPDLIQDGNEGLLQAVEKYDPSKGLKFSTYASYWIRQRMSRSIKKNSRLIRIPSYMYDRYSKIIKVEEQLGKRLGYAPDASEIAEHLEGFSESDVRETRGYFNQDPLSLDLPTGDESGSILLDFSPDRTAEDPLDIVSSKDFLERVLSIIDELFDERYKYIFFARFGFLDGEVHTLQEIADEVGVTRERVRQIQEKIIRKLKHPLNNYLFS